MENVYKNKNVVAQYELSRTIPSEILESYVVNILAATHVTSMCEVGFGKGSTLTPFSRIIHSVGIDSSKAMCDYVRSMSSNQQVTIIQGDGRHICELLPPQELIHMKAVLHLQQNPHVFVDSLVNALLPNGYLAIGREVSQPEDNLEDLGEYSKHHAQDDVLADFYSTYFASRKEMKQPFAQPIMPAGSLREVSRYLTSSSLIKFCEFQTQKWNKQITLDELITSIRVGTFSVFSKGLTSEQRSNIAQQMLSYCDSKKYDINRVRTYDAYLECIIFQKKTSTKDFNNNK